MAISYVGSGAFAAQTTDVAAAAYPAGLVDVDAVVAFFATKPASVSATNISASDTFLGFSTNGQASAGNDAGSMRSAAIQRAGAALASSAGSVNATYVGNNVTGGVGMRFRTNLSATALAAAYVALEDSTESGTAVSASSPQLIPVDTFKAGDLVAIHVAIKSDAINHTGQSLTIQDCTVGPVTWQTKMLSTAGGDLAVYTGYAQITAGASVFTSTATYAATSSSSTGSAAAVSLVRLREEVVGGTAQFAAFGIPL